MVGCAVGQRLLDAEVAVDEVARALVDDDLGHVADLVEHAREGRALGLRMDAPVRRVGEQLVGRLLAGADDPERHAGAADTAGLDTSRLSHRPMSRVNRDTARLFGKPNRKTVAPTVCGAVPSPHDEGPCEDQCGFGLDVPIRLVPKRPTAKSRRRSPSSDGP